MLLKNKVAIITGSSRGIGRAIALEFARQGAYIVISYLGNEIAAEKTKKEVDKFGVKSTIIKANILNFSECEKLISQTCDSFGKVDILVNNAGITKDNLFLKMKEDEWDEVVNTNLKGVFNCTKAITKLMLKQRSGCIINMTSVVGIIGNIGQANYAAAKAGVIGLTKSLAKELASRNIRVNAIAPGFIETDMTAVISEKAASELIAKIPLARFGQAKEVAELTVFLASDAAAYITGQVINVDGGMVI